jgi:RHS repeat-associated protein
MFLPGGGSIEASYDVLGRKKEHTVTFDGLTDHETFEYDAMNRLRRASNGTARVTFDYNLFGSLERTRLMIGPDEWSIHAEPYEDGTRRTLELQPSGLVLDEDRSPTGLLVSSKIRGGDTLMSVMSYAMAGVPGEVVMGPITRHDTYDLRRRLVKRTYVVGQKTVAELRYAYDEADREIARQYMHRGGRTDFFDYDRDSRLTRAELGARPELIESTTAPWTAFKPAAIDGTWRAGHYGRTHNFSAIEPDLVETTSTARWTGETVPRVAIEMGQADALGALTYVDSSSLSRTRDALGNTTSLRLADGWATVKHDGLSRLREITTARGVTVRYGYRPDGMRATREILCTVAPPQGPPCRARSEVLLYDGLQLLEVHETAPNDELRARYYYEDGSDVPFAADLLDPQTHTLERYYFVTDRQGSVIGVLDENGTWIERVTYDPWGTPTFEPADLASPEIAEIAVDTTGAARVRFTEAVLPPLVDAPQSGASEIATSLVPLADSIELIDPADGNRRIPGTWSYLELAPGAARGSVLRFAPGETMTSSHAYAVRAHVGALLDAWSNEIAETTRTFTWGAGTRYAGPQGSTTTTPVGESLVGNEAAFQGHSWEAAVGLYHMRGRVFEPYTGTFLQGDPNLYADAANRFVGFANAPTLHRDPTGRDACGPSDAALTWMSLDEWASQSRAGQAGCASAAGPSLVMLGIGAALALLPEAMIAALPAALVGKSEADPEMAAFIMAGPVISSGVARFRQVRFASPTAVDQPLAAQGGNLSAALNTVDPDVVAARAARQGVRVPTNYRGEPVLVPPGHTMSPRDLPLSEPPIFEKGPFTAGQREAFLQGESAGTRLAPHHRHQIPTSQGGVIDEIPGPGHPAGNLHTGGSPSRHPGPSVFRSSEGGEALRSSEIRAHWRSKGGRLIEIEPGVWVDPGPL